VEDAVVPATPNSVSAVEAVPFTFASGVPEFGTTESTVVTVTSAGATPDFAVTSGVDSADGTMSFGSCHFTIKHSSFASTSPLRAGNTVVVNPCSVKVNTKGQTANGQPSERTVSLLLGVVLSIGARLGASVTPDGHLFLAGHDTGFTITVAPATGGG
jgi:hypothetical protein